jgi:Sulfotransferase family
MLRENPEISGFHKTSVPEDEGQHLQTVFPAAQTYGGPGRFGFMPEAHLTEDSVLINSKNRDKLFQEWSAYWDLGRSCLLEKSPPNLIRTRFLQAMFSNARFVIILRHPIAVSLATWKWARCSLDSLMDHWLHCHRLFELDRPHLRYALVVKYEDLIRATEPAMEQIYQFLGLPHRVSPPLDHAGNDRYFVAWRKLSGSALSQHIIAKYERKVRPYGYSLVNYGTTMPAAFSSASENPRFRI